MKKISRSIAASMVALRLGASQRGEIDRNRAMFSSPVMSAVERYTGVLYDAFDVHTLSPGERAFADEHVVIHSALFGLLRADDEIPAYRLSHNSVLPGPTLKAIWRQPLARELATLAGPIVDFRSKPYVALGPPPPEVETIRVVVKGENGNRLAVSHANKAEKGALLRAMVAAGIDHDSGDSILDWARRNSIALERTETGFDLVAVG